MRDLVSLITQVSKGLIRDQQTRRQIMFWGLTGALVMLFMGSVLLHWMRQYPLFFLLYWLACAWITLLSMMLAVFDLLVIRAAARQARKRLEAEYLDDVRRKKSDDPKSS